MVRPIVMYKKLELCASSWHDIKMHSYFKKKKPKKPKNKQALSFIFLYLYKNIDIKKYMYTYTNLFYLYSSFVIYLFQSVYSVKLIYNADIKFAFCK